ncbi:MAG TPA: EntF family bacteriocin induction factor [Enterococcus columbae]|nr:EntF family bacteriocin induction factor [Enterococcus columbae]
MIQNVCGDFFIPTNIDSGRIFAISGSFFLLSLSIYYDKSISIIGRMKKMKKMDLKWKKYSEKELIRVIGGKNAKEKGKPASNLAQCVFSFFRKCE